MLIGSIGHRSAALIEKSTCFFFPFSGCTACTGNSPVALLYLCISCNLLLLIKQYVEVHVEIRGSSQKRTGKSEVSYVEVHNEKPGSSLWFLDIRNATVDERTGRFIGETDRVCTGKFAYIRKVERIVVWQTAIVIVWRNRSYGKVHKEPYWQHVPYGEVLRTPPSLPDCCMKRSTQFPASADNRCTGKFIGADGVAWPAVREGSQS